MSLSSTTLPNGSATTATAAAAAASSSTTTNPPSTFASNRYCSLWRSRLSSAFRTALACTIVGVSTIYAPSVVCRHLTFPAFSYVTAILIVGEATLGDSLYGAASALYGTVFGVLPAMLTLFLIQPDGFSIAATTLAVVLSSFMVALPDSADLIAKRIALGQIVIIYVAPFKQVEPNQAKAVWHPVNVAASTAVGVVASVLALAFPYPRLACYEVREKSKLYMEMATERLRLLVNAFYANNAACMSALVSQARCLAAESAKLLQNIKLKQGSLQRERLPFKFLPPHVKVPSDRLQDIETPLTGMEIALSSTTSFPIKFLDRQLKGVLLSLRDHITVRLRQANIIANTRQENLVARIELQDKPHLSLPDVVPQNLNDLSPLFFLFCINLLHNGTLTTPSSNGNQENKVMPTTKQTTIACRKEPNPERRNNKNAFSMMISSEKLVGALKCSLSLGLAVLFGVLFSKDNGYWSGLTVAITITPWREATFKLANDRAQGTAIGSVYGVLALFISQNLMELRFLALLPWIIFTSFLRRSRMYGHAGGIAAIISTLVILGRRNYGPPSVFAFARLTETSIGLCCSILVELLLQPTRASTLARAQLSKSLRTLNELVDSLVPSSTGPVPLKDKEKKLKQQVNALRKYMDEAQVEPNFWFLPFPEACYRKLHGSLSKMVELLWFLVRGIELLEEESHGLGSALWKEIQGTIKGDLEQFKKMAGSPLKCFEEVIQVESLGKLVKDLQREAALYHDLELGNYGVLSADEEESENMVAIFLQHALEVVERLDVEVGEDLKSQVVLRLATFGYCIRGLAKETREMENGILELLQWENPGSHINLRDIACEIKTLTA